MVCSQKRDFNSIRNVIAALALIVSACLVPVNFATAAEKSEVRCPPEPTSEMSDAEAQRGMDRAKNHGFMWRITKGDHTSFLYGTIHIGKFDWMFPGDKVIDALSSSDTMALELDAMDTGLQARLGKLMIEMSSGTSLPEALQVRMQKQAAAACVPYNTISGLFPAMQIVMVSMLASRLDGLEPAYAVDPVLAGVGHELEMNVVSLETPELQLKMLKMANERETIAVVEEGLADIESGRVKAQTRRIARAWENADYHDMEHFEEWCDCLDTETDRKMMKRLLDERNPDMAKKIDALHKSGKNVFVAVGSLHMFGPLGLPKLMQQRGYNVERVDFKSNAKASK